MDLLTLLVVIPMVATVVVVLLPAEQDKAIKAVAALAGAACLGIAAYFFNMALGTNGEAALAEYTAGVAVRPWVESIGITWAVGIDGIGVAMVLLNSIVMFTGVLVSSHAIRDRVKEFFILFLALGTGVFGVFIVRDLFFMYFAFELAVVPMYLLIGVWGSPKDREYAAMKLTLYLTAGALVALIGLLLLYFKTWEYRQSLDPAALPSFNLDHVIAASDAGFFTLGFQNTAFAFLFVGFAAIIPMWPLHTWSPIGHAAAPAAGSMMHAGVLMKLGSFAILRVAFPTLPDGAVTWLPWVALIALANIVYGGYVAMAQKDIKYVIGFSSSSHMGYTLLGIASVTVIGVSGAVFLMFAHGVMTALCFGLIGFFYDQTHTRKISDLGGLAHQMPWVATCFALATMASAGVPGFANFVSEFMVMVGAWQAGYEWHAVIAVFGVVITAVYLLRALRDVFFGPRNEKWDKLEDARGIFQRAPFVILLVVLLFFGFWPRPITRMIEPAITPIVEKIAKAQQARAERESGRAERER